MDRAQAIEDSPVPATDAHVRLIAPSRVSLSDRVAAILRRYVLVEELTAGSRMPPERQLAGTLNISRTVLREAISRLIGEGILTRSSPRTLIVASFDRAAVSALISPIDREAAEFRDLMELRIIMEIGAIDAIVSRVTARHLAEIERWLVEGERRLAAGEPVHSADARFHAALLRTLGNRAVDAFLPMLQDQMRTHIFFSPHQLRQTSVTEDTRVQREHRQIYEAIRGGDAESARRVMIAHLSHYLIKRPPPED